MEEILLNSSMVNSESVAQAPHIYTAEEISLMLAALGACVASIIYSFKHIKSSSCLGFSCKQAVDEVHVKVDPIVHQESEV